MRNSGVNPQGVCPVMRNSGVKPQGICPAMRISSVKPQGICPGMRINGERPLFLRCFWPACQDPTFLRANRPVFMNLSHRTVISVIFGYFQESSKDPCFKAISGQLFSGNLNPDPKADHFEKNKS